MYAPVSRIIIKLCHFVVGYYNIHLFRISYLA